MLNPMNQELHDIVVYAPEVAVALRQGRPIVALESTVLAHGLPRPLNVEVARSMEAIVRDNGAVPATLAVLDGMIHAGLSLEQLDRLGTGTDIAKASLRDLPLLLARGESGATTVSATAHLAALLGIKVFATGGIGGVHRGWESSLDVSADLPALASSPVVVVCAGAKSVLDLPATLEWLETNGVPVLGYQTDTFPAFYTRAADPPLPVDARVDTPEEVAEVYRLRRRLGFDGGVLLCRPVPEEHALDTREVEHAVQAGLRDAEAQGIKGRAVTPFLLSALSRATEGRSLAANRSLLEHNAALAAAVARAITPPNYV
jgi:pseudouridine-5'-phosphate glycosidase